MTFNTIEEAVESIKNGEIIIIVDDESRENEGDFVMAAEKITPDAVNFMATHGKGLICMPAAPEFFEKTDLKPMVQHNTDSFQTNFTVSIDHMDSGTGISAAARALTIKEFCNPKSTASDFRRPGHIFPLIAKPHGVIQRNGHTEAAVDLARLAGLEKAGVICEIMKEDGTMARRDDLFVMAKQFGLKIITIADLILYIQKKELALSMEAHAKMPTKYGDFEIYGFIDPITKRHHIALVKGNISDGKPVLSRMHSKCLTGDALGSCRCDCGEQYAYAMQKIADQGRGVLLYLNQEGRGIGLINKLKAYELQDQGLDTVEANIKLGFPEDMRDYAVAAYMYRYLGVKEVELMTNNPQKIKEIEKFGVKVVGRVPIQLKDNEHNAFYLKTKKEKMDHILDI
ncbi:MAG: bifunctional 3,4-dihydroxy-2-butanone-4-phosphate synthase/GTP cyclohydrolase II [Brevinema sp.]